MCIGDGDVDEGGIGPGGSFVARFVDRSVATRASTRVVVARGDAHIGVDVDVRDDEWWCLER